MTIEELREALAHLPVFSHTPVVVTGDYNGVRDVARLDYNSQGVLIEAGVFSESEWAQMARERTRERDERLLEREAALLLLVDDLLTGKPRPSVSYLQSLRHAVIHEQPLPTRPIPKSVRRRRAIGPQGG